jgi:hypothetical protein
MSSYNPWITAAIAAIPFEYSYLVDPPIAFPAIAEDVNEQDDGYIDTGDYKDHIGEVWGESSPYLDPNGCSLVTGRNVGITFDAIGTFLVQDDWIDPLYSTYGILLPNQGAGATPTELRQHTADTNIRYIKFVLRRGVPPLGSTPTPSNCYVYVQFLYGSMLDYRMAFEYSRPVRLQVSYDTGTTWTDVDQGRKLPTTEAFFHLYNDCVVMQTEHDQLKGYFAVNLGNGLVLMHKAPELTLGTSPLSGIDSRLRVLTSNGYTSFTVMYNYHTDVVVKNNFSVVPPTNASMAFLVGNALTQDFGTLSGAVSNDGSGNFSYTATVTKPDDSGMALGSSTPPRFTDGTCVVPAYWSTTVPGGVNPTTVTHPKCMRVDEHQVWDENNRVGYWSGTLFVNNYTGQYNGVVGKQAIQISSGINGGSTNFVRVTGVCGSADNGNQLENPASAADIIRVPVFDKSDMMGNGQPPVVLGYEVQLDGWCIFSAVRFLTEKGNIHPSTLSLADNSAIYYPPGAPTTPPGTNGYAPYGPADGTCPYPILGRGVGDTPRYVFDRSMTPWQCLQKLVMEESYEYTDPMTGLIYYIPYMMYFDANGYFHFEPYHPALLSVTCGFTYNLERAIALYPATTWYPLSNFGANYSIAQMRSEITFQSVDAITNELLEAHLDMPAYTKEKIGHYSNWIEGNGRWADQGTLNDLVLTAGGQASIPSSTAMGSVPFIPNLFAGQRVSIFHPYIGASPIDFYIIQLDSSYGHGSLYGEGGTQQNTSQFVARAIANYL